MKMLFLGIVLFFTLPFLALGEWTASIQKGLVVDWEAQEREDMTLLLLNLRRTAFPETEGCDRLRRAEEGFRRGMSLARAFSRFRGGNSLFRILFFSGDGTRLVPPGFSRDFMRLSEHVMKGIFQSVAAGNEETTQLRRLSSQFFGGGPRSLGWVAEAPRSLVALPRGSTYQYAGWWPIRSGNKKTQGNAHHVLLLVKGDDKEFENFFRDRVGAFRKKLSSSYQLRWFSSEEVGRVITKEGSDKGKLEAVRRFLGKDRPGYLSEVQSMGERGVVALLRPAVLPRFVQERLDFLVMIHGLGRGLVIVGVILLGGMAITGRLARTPLRLVMGMAVLGVVIPALAVFATGAQRYGREYGERMKWRLHRDIEAQLSSVDQGYEEMERAIELAVEKGLKDLPTLMDSPLEGDWQDLRVADFLRMAWVFDASGTAEWSRVLTAGKSEQEQKLCGFVVRNIDRVLRGHPTPEKTGDSVIDYAFFHGQARFALTQMGRIFPLEGFGRDFNMLIEHLPARSGSGSGLGLGPGEGPRYFVGILRGSGTLKWKYLAQIRQRQNPGFRMGVVGVGPSGPVWSLPARMLLDTRVQALCDQAFRLKEVVDGALERTGGRSWLVTAFPGHRMTDRILVGGVSMGPVLARAGRFQISVVSVILGLLGAAIFAVYLLTGYFEARLGNLGNALQRLRVRDFDLELGIGPDEFGVMADGLNKSAHTLSEIVQALPVQKTLVFDGSLKVGGVQVEGRFFPASILGGDFSEAFLVGDSRLVVAIGDVTGSGVDSALMGAKVKLGLRMLAERLDDPGEILTVLNRHLVTGSQMGKHLALFLGLLDLKSRGFSWSNAGNCWPLLARNCGTTWLRGSQRPLGRGVSRRFSAFKMELEAGDSLVFFTNGWVKGSPEAEGSEGSDAYEGFARRVLNAFGGDLKSFFDNLSEKKGRDGDHPFQDDRTMILLRMQASSGLAGDSQG